MYVIGHFHVLLGLFFVNINTFLNQRYNMLTLSVFSMNTYVCYSSLCWLIPLLQEEKGFNFHFSVYGLLYGFPGDCLCVNRINIYK